MKDYGLTRSTVEPQEVEITETKVFVATDIHPVTIVIEDNETTEYEFNLVEYDKDDYIKIISNKNTELERQMTDTQLALCDVYEALE